MMTGPLAHVEFQMTRSDEIGRGAVGAFCAHIRSRGFAPRHIFDVGANKGDWSREAKRNFPGCRVTLIEPQIEMSAYLDRFCAETDGSRWINAGAGGFDGHAEFTVCGDSVSSSFLITREEATRELWQQRTVPLITLDSVCRDGLIPAPDLVKVDVE